MLLGLAPLLTATLALGKSTQTQTSEALGKGRSLIQDRPHVPTVLDIPRSLPNENNTNEFIKKYLDDSEQDLAQQPYVLSGHPLPSELPALELLLKNHAVSNRESSP